MCLPCTSFSSHDLVSTLDSHLCVCRHFFSVLLAVYGMQY